MRISIVIPVYNTAEYLRPCVNSILANDCDHCEIILVDDGSTDGVCPALCDSIASEHPHLIRVVHQENKGLGGARNSGIEASRGKYLFFIDGDDTIAPNTLTSLKAATDTDCDIISFGMCTHYGDEKFTRVTTNAFYSGAPFKLCERKDFLLSLPGATYRIWKKELFTSSDIYFPTKVWYEDLRTTPKLFAKADSIMTVEGDFYRYLQRQGSIMNSGNIERNGEIMAAFDDLIQYFKGAELFETYKNELYKLAIDHLLLAASVRVAKQDPEHPLLSEFLGYMTKNFPDWKACPYIAQLSSMHKLLLWLIGGKHFKLVRTLFRIKDRI